MLTVDKLKIAFGERGGQNAANIRKLLDLARAQGGTLADFVARIELLTTADDQEGEAGLDADADAVHVLTIHAAKGLEYDHVFVSGVEEIERGSGRGGVLGGEVRTGGVG